MSDHPILDLVMTRQLAAAVRALHSPRDFPDFAGRMVVTLCAECRQSWPCATEKAMLNSGSLDEPTPQRNLCATCHLVPVMFAGDHCARCEDGWTPHEVRRALTEAGTALPPEDPPVTTPPTGKRVGWGACSCTLVHNDDNPTCPRNRY